MNTSAPFAGSRRFIVSACLFFPLLPLQAASLPAPAELTFLTWGDYISEEVVADFEAEFNARIRFVLFESDEARDEILTTTGADGYDLILVDSVSRSFYQRLGWITDFDRSLAPNLARLRLPETAGLQQSDGLCAPYAWGTTGIAYRKDLVPEPITRWQQLFQPADALKGRVLMSASGEEVVGMALKSLGYSMVSSDGTELEQARQLLVAQAPLVAGYSAVAADTQGAKLVTGEVSAVLTYSGDALMMKENQPHIEYVLPEEGGAVWADFVCLGARAAQSELAHRFMDFLGRPEQSARNALYIYSATPNTDAESLLPAEFLADPVVYPDGALLAKSERYQSVPPRTAKLHQRIMQELQQLTK